jgi:hypothetical protein
VRSTSASRWGRSLPLAKEYLDLPLDELEALLDTPVYEARVDALSITD